MYWTLPRYGIDSGEFTQKRNKLIQECFTQVCSEQTKHDLKFDLARTVLLEMFFFRPADHLNSRTRTQNEAVITKNMGCIKKECLNTLSNRFQDMQDALSRQWATAGLPKFLQEELTKAIGLGLKKLINTVV
jgi:hypothetical protein